VQRTQRSRSPYRDCLLGVVTWTGVGIICVQWNEAGERESVLAACHNSACRQGKCLVVPGIDSELTA
jgi:hypothetical protein